MSEHDDHTAPSEVTRVARDLSAIVDLAASLDDQAEHKANDRDLPGGAAMVNLGPVANLEAWEHRYEAAEHWGTDTSHVTSEDPEWEPALQTLCFWSEAWRVEHNRESDRRPTLVSETAFIRGALDWAWDNEIHWDDFARDINRARVRLEEVLYAGLRVERTRVHCIEIDCDRKPRLIKVYRETAIEDHYKCPACKVRYTRQRFTLAKAELLASQDANRHVPMQDAMAAIDRSDRTFRKWLRFWYVRSYRDPLTGTVLVWWPDVRDMDEATPRRNRAVA